MRIWEFGSCGLLWLVCAVTPVAGQQVDARFASADTARAPRTWSTLRVAKWSTLAVSLGVVTYGFVENRSADREYTAIEKLCEQDASNCERVSETGPYRDAALESRYQSVVARDRHARNALLAGQVGIAASVILFVLDLPASATPQDVPYEPHRIRLGVGGGNGQIRLCGRVALL